MDGVAAAPIATATGSPKLWLIRIGFGRRMEGQCLPRIAPAVFWFASFVFAFPFVASAQGVNWNELGDEPLLKEAEAAAQLGYLTAQGSSIETASDAPTALQMLDGLLARTDSPDAIELGAMGLKLRVLSEGWAKSEAEALLSSLPSPLPGLDEAASGRLKRVWTARHAAASDDWDRVPVELDAVESMEGLPGAARAEMALLQAQVQLRRPGQEAAGYAALAQAIVNAPGLAGGAAKVEAGFGAEDFLSMDYLGAWAAQKAALAALDAAAETNPIARRRYLEFTAATLHPLIAALPDATREEMTAIRARRTALAALAGSGPDAAELAAGGMRALAAHALYVEDLFHGGRRSEILPYVASLGGAPEGVPTSVWADHKKVWEMLGLGVQYRWTDILKDESGRAAAFGRIPIRENLAALTCLGGAHSRQASGGGLKYFARIFATDACDPRTLNLLKTEILVKATPEQAGEFLRALGAQPGSAQAMAMRAWYAMERGNPVAKDPLVGIEGEAMADAARALDLADRRRSPAARGLRALLLPAISKAAAFEGGAEAAARLAEHWRGPVKDNPVLSRHLRVPATSLALADEAARPTDFARVRDFVSPEDGERVRTFLDSVGAADLARAVDTLPADFKSDEEFLAAGAILDEALSRGQAGSGLSTAGWEKVRARHAEQMLCRPADFEEGLAELNEIAGQTGQGSPAVQRARSIVSAFEGTMSDAAYAWAMKQLILAWEYKVARLSPLGVALAQRTRDGYLARVGQLTPADRSLHAIYVGYALMNAGDYEGSAEFFTRVCEDPDLPEGSEPQWVGESRRLQAWEQQATARGASETERTEAAQQMLDYAKDRYADFPDGRKRLLVVEAGLWAAKRLDDAEDAAVFDAEAVRLRRGTE